MARESQARQRHNPTRNRLKKKLELCDELFNAAGDDLEKLIELLNQHKFIKNVHAKNTYQRTLIHCVITSDDDSEEQLTSAVRRLIELNVDVNNSDNDDITALMLAASQVSVNNADVLELLYNAGAQIASRDNMGQTALHYAMFSRKIFVYEYNAESEYDTDSSTDLVADSKDDSENIGLIEAVQFLVETANADVNVRSQEKETPLYMAVQGKLFNVTKYLLLRPGIEPHIKGPHGRTPLHEAVLHKLYKFIPLFAGHKKVLGTGDDKKNTPLHVAVSENDDQAVNCLINAIDTTKENQKEKAELLNKRNKKGKTPLFMAAEQGYSLIVKMLALAGADINIPNKAEKTALQCTTDPSTKELLQRITNDPSKLFVFEGDTINAPLDKIQDLSIAGDNKQDAEVVRELLSPHLLNNPATLFSHTVSEALSASSAEELFKESLSRYYEEIIGITNPYGISALKFSPELSIHPLCILIFEAPAPIDDVEKKACEQELYDLLDVHVEMISTTSIENMDFLQRYYIDALEEAIPLEELLSTENGAGNDCNTTSSHSRLGLC